MAVKETKILIGTGVIIARKIRERGSSIDLETIWSSSRFPTDRPKVSTYISSWNYSWAKPSRRTKILAITNLLGKYD
jgi:hypothetical protein